VGNGEDKGNMDDVVNQLAKELADAIGAAVADNAKIEACRAKARDAGFDLRVSIEAVVGFVNRTSGAAVTRVTTPARLLPGKREYELTSNDRRFLRSLRISCDESKKEAVEVASTRPLQLPQVAPGHLRRRRQAHQSKDRRRDVAQRAT